MVLIPGYTLESPGSFLNNTVQGPDPSGSMTPHTVVTKIAIVNARVHFSQDLVGASKGRAEGKDECHKRVVTMEKNCG